MTGRLAALCISFLGIYSVLAYMARRRTREFGIRLAVGATRSQIMRLVFDRAVHIVLLALLVAVLVASAASRIVEHSLYQLMPNGIESWIVVPVLILATAVSAAMVPAWRAARVDPATTLRAL